MCAQHCKAVAAAYAPRSPTMANHSAALKRKKRTTAHRYPGSLEKSIECESSADRASVFVRQNALCVSATGYNYAKRIHDERGKSIDMCASRRKEAGEARMCPQSGLMNTA